MFPPMRPWQPPSQIPESPDPSPTPLRTTFAVLGLVVLVELAIVAFVYAGSSVASRSAAAAPRTVSISQVLRMAQQQQVRSAVIAGDQVNVTTFAGATYQATKENGAQLTQLLMADGVRDVTVRPPQAPSLWQQLADNWIGLLMLLGLVVLLLGWVRRRVKGEGSDFLTTFGRTRAAHFDATHPAVHFRDVAGAEEVKEELQEVVSFLRAPSWFARLGARMPKGVLLVGPPGTGKTLIARAVAGEAGVAFFSASGAEFIEMYVGVGASRVRDLFEKAKKHAPSIIFIDEIDAVGRHRHAGATSGNDERDHTLNQLLVEMDGFQPRDNVVVIAATNRPDILDTALLRPGRFDRHVVLDAPDLAGRTAILQVHSAGKPLAADVSLDRLAEQTSGFSGADLANVVNEAALLAARRKQDRIGLRDLEEATLRVVSGPERKSHVVSAADKAIVAYHELGHAIVMRLLPGCDTVRKVTTVARGMALGLTVAAPSEERTLWRREELKARLAGLMGGRAAEELTFGDFTTGAAQDIKQATELARRMVCEFGMSPLGTVLITDEAGVGLRLASEVDAEVTALVDEAHAAASRILREHHEKLEALANVLIRVETLDASEFERLLFADSAEEATMCAEAGEHEGQLSA